jgi:hypothetical protein
MRDLYVSNDRHDRGAAAHLASDRGSDTAHSTTDPDAEFLRVVVAAIAFADVDTAGLDPGHLGDQTPNVWPSKKLSRQRLGVQDGLADFWVWRGCHRHFAAELIRRPGFALPILGGVQCVDFGAALPVILITHPHCPGRPLLEAQA